jgi:phosphohistidine phosphatase
MNLYLARHGQAASSEPGKSMNLTEQGKADVIRVGQALADRQLNIQQIWHSPKARTKQTAEIYASFLKLDNSNLIENKALSMDGDIDLFYHELLESKIKNLLIVSHEPQLEELSSFLITGSDHLPRILFPTAGVAAFEQDPNWRYLWLLTPSTLK